MTSRQTVKYGHSLGYTLIEILIALTLFSVILMLVFSALHTSSKSWIASEQQIAANEDKRLILTFIKRQLSQVVPLLQINGKKNNVVFKGEQDSLRFVSALPAHRGGGGLYLLTLRADEDLTLYYQIVTTNIDLATDLDNEKIKSQVLIADIDKIEFSYFGSEDTDDTPTWYEQWENQKQLPDLISLRIRSKDSSEFWPEVLIPIRTQVSRGLPQFTLYNIKDASRI